MSKYHNNLVRTTKALLDDKSIELKMGVMLPGAEAPDDSPRQTVKPDLIGTDAEDNITIVEVKTGLLRWMPEGDDTYYFENNNDAVRESVGQVLDYARAKIREMYPDRKLTAEEMSDTIKKELAEFFVNEAEDNDYEFFSPVIDKITEIRKEFGI